ncbi:MAG: AAA family ATPase [Streptosporangiaceae bacterium]|jgi:DNA-binding CsgD family transcriptional regulator
MRCPILVGREGPASVLADAVCRLRGDRGGEALVVVGEAGVGKTRLAEYLDDAAAQAGIRVVHGRALPEGLGGSLRPVAEILLELTRNRPPPGAAGLVPYVTVVASVVPHWRFPGWSAAAEPVVVMAEAVLRVLQWATGGAGVVVILEDLHWADDATLAVFRYLVDHASEVPVLLFATIRTGEGRGDVRALLEAGGAQVCPIGRLTDDQAREMATACAGAASLPGESLTAVVREAEGLPLLVEDLLATGDLGGIAPRFADTVRARLARLDARQRAVVGAAAVLGRQFDWRLLEQAAGVQGKDVIEALHRCTALQLVVTDGPGFAFRHALTRDVILAGLAVPERCRLSQAAAKALASVAGDHDDGQVLMTARLLADGGEPLRAAQLLLTAGRRALAAGSLASAELFLREAAAATGSSEDLRAEVECQLAHVLLHAGKPSEAAMIASRMVSITDGRDPAAATAMRLVLARAEVLTAAWDNAWTHLADVRRSRPGDPAVGAEVAVIEAQVALGDGRPGSRARAAHLAAQAAGIARDAGRPDLACEALEALGSCARLHDLGAAAAAFARALDVAATGNLRVHRLRILNELGTVEMLRDARGERLEQARSEASRAGAVGLAVGIGANIAALMAMTARFTDAMEVASEVELTSRRLGLIPLQAAALLMQGFAMAHQGRLREMEHYLAAAEATAPEDPDLRAGAWAIGRGISALLAEDRIGARHAFARARAEAPDQHARILNPYEGPELLLRALAAEAGQAEINTASAGVVTGARWPQLWFGAARAVARGADGDTAGAVAALNAALDAADRYPVFSALTMRLTAEAAIRDNWGTPGELLRTADATFTRLRLGRASAACRALLKAAGQPAPRRRTADTGLPARLVAAGVTTREAQVLDLLADRLSNREIAGRLFLSPRTVEKHVAALLAKLGGKDRSSLAALAHSLR